MSDIFRGHLPGSSSPDDDDGREERPPDAGPAQTAGCGGTPAVAHSAEPLGTPGSAETSYPVQGDLRDLHSAAPEVGRIRPMGTPIIRPGLPIRGASVQLDGVKCGAFFLAAGSQAGLSHLHDGTPRQDSYDFVVLDNGRLIVAVADGLGSRPYSQLGARVFGEQVVNLAVKEPGLSAAEYLREGGYRVAGVASKWYEVEPELVGFVAAVAVFDHGSCEIARVGDVSAFARNADEDFAEIFPYDSGGSVNQVSASLPGEAQQELVETASDRVVIATDGLAADIRNSASIRAWLGEQWSHPITASAMNNALRFRRQGSHDDRTGVVVWRPVIDVESMR